jgi:hypothetical protein
VKRCGTSPRQELPRWEVKGLGAKRDTSSKCSDIQLLLCRFTLTPFSGTSQINMHIKIAASPAISGADERLHWTVDTYANEKPINQGLFLHDPLDKEGTSLCRWYLEQYLQKEPYSTSKARKAASALEGYGQRLVDQLQLSDLIFDDDQKLEIEIEDCSVSSSGPRSSVHQLYWEFLEDERIWTVPMLSICVQRSIGTTSQHPSTTDTISSWPYGSSSRQRINILLVTARDLTSGSTLYGEISPSVASNILWNVKSRLDLARSPVDLNVEVVRPGTFNALKRHLEHRRRQGQDYFQIVHFDVHGKVGTRKNAPASSKFSFLYFSDPNGYGTKPVAASQVAKLLREYNIPIVVLNACESARANAGDDANIAKTFARAGVKNILAMVYKASESAMLRFLENFYKEFLIEGRSFTNAATLARRILRSDSARDARFHLQLPLHDWFVPVVYSSVPELSLIRPYKVQQPPVEGPSRTETTCEVSFPGREFDLLRLEKGVLQNGLLYLYGPPGVGKTSLLRYAESSWKRSSFIDVVVFLDFSTERISSFDQCLDKIIRQIGATKVGKDANIRVSEDHESKSKRLRDILSDLRVVFILDGLADFRVTQARDVGSQYERILPASILIPFLRTLLQPSRSGETELSDEKHLVIISGRAKEQPDFIGNDESSLYELKGLPVAEAVDMVHKIMTGPVPTAVQPQKPRDELAEIWKAEPLIHLLQRNPAALLQFSQLARDSELSLREMYDILHSENPVHRLDPSMLNHFAGLLGEFGRLISTVSDECCATLLMVGWYWHEGPSVSDFSEMLISSKIVSEDSVICEALQQASRWGYIKFQPKGQISWIHSLFTIFTRILACSSFSRLQFHSGDSKLDFRRVFATFTMGHLVSNSGEFLPWPASPMHGLEYAVRLMVTVLSSHWARDLNKNFWTYLILFLRTTKRLSDRLSTMFLTKGLEHPGRGEYCDRCKQNFLFTLKLCRGRGLLPLPRACWPTNAIMGEGHLIYNSCNTEEAFIIAKYYEELLKGAITFSQAFSGRNAVKPDDLADIIALASALVEIHRRHIPMVESRQKEFIEFTDSVIEASEQAFGVSSDPSILSGKNLLSFMKAVMLLEDYKTEDSKLEVQRALRGFHESLDQSNATTAARFETFLSGKSPDHATLWRSFLKSSQSGFQKLENAWEMMSKEALGYSDTDLSTLPKIDLRKAGHPLFKVWESFPQLQREYRIATSNLEFYEKDIDRGHWARAMGLHSRFVLKSMENLDFDQALDHITAQENLAEQHGVADDFQDKIQDARHLINLYQPFISSITSKETVSEDQFTSFQKECVQFTEKRSIKSAEMDQIFDVVKESLTRDVDPNLPHNSAPGILMGGGDPSAMLQSSFQRHLTKSSRSSDYRQMVLRNISNVLTSLQKLEHAEDESNENAIFPCLTQLQQLSEDEQHSEFIKKDAIQKRRNWNTLRLLGDIASRVRAIAEIDKTDERRKLLERCKNIVSLSGDARPEVREFVNQLAVLTETLHLDSLTKLAFAALDVEDHKMAVLLLNDILRLVQDGTFSRALAPGVIGCDILQTVQEAYYRSSVILAVDESRWADGLKSFSEWRSHDELWNILMTSERREATLRLEEVCRSMFNLQDFFRALQELDLLRSAWRLGDVRSSYGAQTTPKVVISQATLDMCDQVFKDTFQHLITAGPEVARRYCSQCISILKEQGLAFLL